MNRISNPRVARRVLWSLLTLATVAVMLLGSQVRAGLSANASVDVAEVWLRPTPPGAKVAAVYAQLHNAADRPLSVTAVRTDVADEAELHEMRTVDGVMRMRHLEEGVRLAPGASAALEPGGVHVMLFGLRQPLRAGERVLLHFTVSDGREVSVYAQVREPQT